MLIPRSVFHVAKACDRDNSRYALAAVKLERDGQLARAVTTDGRRLVVSEWVDDGDFPVANETKDDFECLVRCDDWKEAESMAVKATRESKAKPGLGRVLLDEASANGKVNLSIHSSNKVRRLEAETTEGKFPKWQNVVPDYDPVTVNDFETAKELAEFALDYDIGDDLRKRATALLEKTKAPSAIVQLHHSFLEECTDIVAKASDCDSDHQGVVLEIPLPELDSKNQIISSAVTIESTDPSGPKTKAVVMPMCIE